MKFTRKIILTRIDKEKIEETSDIVVCEYPLTIYLNGEEIATLLCLPKSLDYLTFGFLFSEGMIKHISDIKSVKIDEEKGKAFINIEKDEGSFPYLKRKKSVTTGSSGGTIFNNICDCVQCKPLDNNIQIHYKKILSLMNNFTSKSEVFQDTGGVHSAALSNGDEMLIFHEDVGRHNALDKVIGEAFIKEVDYKDKIALTSGRISSEMLMKVAKRNISILVSRSAPMDLALKIGKEINMTIIGFVRGQRMNIYSGKERIIFDS